MSTTTEAREHDTLSGLQGNELDEAVRVACARIAPTWPLDRFIAVNPFWGMVSMPMSAVASALASSSGSRLLMPRAWYAKAYERGEFGDRHLEAAIRSSGATGNVGQLRALMQREAPEPLRRSRVVDVVDAGRDIVHAMSWRDFVTHSVSQYCAAFFDESQATLPPDREGGLFASWRRQARVDRGPALLMGLSAYRSVVDELPSTAHAMLTLGIAALGIAPGDVATYLWDLLLDQNGWASWCAYRRWTARLAGDDDHTIVDLLAIKLAWEFVLLRTAGTAVAQQWRLAMASRLSVMAADDSQADDWILQRAVELAWQDQVIGEMPAGLRVARPAAPAVQAVFCIDVRSEVFRRALEVEAAEVQTLGFAGFFGLPIDYLPTGATEPRPQLPGLLSPRLRVLDAGVSQMASDARRDRRDVARSWQELKTGALSTFTFVEAMGLTYAVALLREHTGVAGRSPSAAPSTLGKPRLATTVTGEPLTSEICADLAAGMLRAMGLTRQFARLVLLVGHGSATRNNPHAAGLDCGACCGQTGEVNARAAAALLNTPEVREGLARRGILVPTTTRFIAGLHQTTTDDVQLFDLEELPRSHTEDLDRLRGWLGKAGTQARTERAAYLGLANVDDGKRDALLRARAHDWAQVRPEWGLANNAAFIVAPREQCRHLRLDGRAFLHDYRADEDGDGSILELSMTAPMVVTHWINMQYYASTVDNVRYGSGNKVLHNVVGGHLGVFEGNGGDLRIGLPMQSLHDGEAWVHTPLRLSVFIAAPRSAIDAVLRKHDTVRALVDNAWLYLFQLDATGVHAYQNGEWSRHAPA